MSDKLPEFMPCLGVIGVIHKKAKIADVCSINRLQVYLDHGWKVGNMADLIEDDT